MLAAVERPQKRIPNKEDFFQRMAQNCLSPIQSPNAVLGIHESLPTRCVHKCPKLVRCAVITRRELEHRLDPVQWEPPQVGKHALDELPPTT